MNFNKILNFISENDISPEEVFNLVEKVKTLDLTDEENIRKVIHEVSRLANKPLDKVQENKIVQEIMQNGINDNLFNLI